MNIKEIKENPTKTRFPPLFKGLPLEVPFNKGDVLKVDTINNPNYKLGKEKLVGRKLIVQDCYKSDIGKLSVYIVKFEQDTDIKNPYLAHHFVDYED